MIGILLAVLILAGVLLSMFGAVAALRAYLRYRRARAYLQGHLTEEVDRLSARTAELERSLSQLDARAQELPVRISEMQRSLAALRVLTEALAASLQQAQRVLSFSALKSFGSLHLSELLRPERLRRLELAARPRPGNAAEEAASPPPRN